MNPCRWGVLFLIGHEKVGKSALVDVLHQKLPTSRVWDFRTAFENAQARLESESDPPAPSDLRSLSLLALAPLQALLEQKAHSSQKNEATPSHPVLIELPADFVGFQHPVFLRWDICIIWLRRRFDRLEGHAFSNPLGCVLSRSPTETEQVRLFRERVFARYAHLELLVPDQDLEGAADRLLGNREKLRTGSEDSVLLPGKSDIPSLQISVSLQHSSPEMVCTEETELPRWRGALGSDVKGLDRLESLRATGQLLWQEQTETWESFQRVFAEWKLDPDHRSLILFSKQGRWHWLHQAMIPRQKMNFFKLTLGRGLNEFLPDIPLSEEGYLARIRTKGVGVYITHRFAVGDSEWVRTLHQSYFDSVAQLFVSVPLHDAEFPQALTDLHRDFSVTRVALSERFARRAYELCEGRVSLRARRTGLVDTLTYTASGWSGDHAAVGALRKCARDWRRAVGERDPRASLALLAVLPDSHEAWVREEFPDGRFVSLEALEKESRPLGRSDWDWILVSDLARPLHLQSLGQSLSSARGVVDLGQSEETAGTELAWCSPTN